MTEKTFHHSSIHPPDAVDYTPVGREVTELMLETFRLNGALLEAGDRKTGPFGLTSALWQVLGSLNEEPLPVAQIARNMGLARQSVQRTANVLERGGFIEYVNNPDHKRAKLAALTEQGREVIEKVTAEQIKWANRLGRDLDLKEIKTTLKVLRLLGGLLTKSK